jgi:hypothetical protein
MFTASCHFTRIVTLLCRQLLFCSCPLIAGKYCSVVGALVRESRLPEVAAMKLTDLSKSPFLASMWPLEVEELQLLLTEQAMPRLCGS